MSSRSLVMTENEGFNEISLELRFILKPNGSIITINDTALEKLHTRKENFFDYFHSSHQPAVFSFLEQIMREQKAYHYPLYHHVGSKNLLAIYNGKLVGDHIHLAGVFDTRSLTKDEEMVNQFFRLTNEDMILREFLLYNADLAVLIINRDDQVIFHNHAFDDLFGLDKDASGKLNVISDLNVNFDLDEELARVLLSLRSHKGTVDRYYYEDDSLFHIQGIYFSDSEASLIIIHDRSYKQRFEKLLMYKQQMESVSQLAAGVAHELRNPLSVIRGFLQLSSLTDDWQKYYNTVMSELTRMNDIIEDFLSVSRKKISKKKQNPAKIFQSLVYIIRSECLLHDVTFEYQIEETDLLVEANEGMIKQVLLNLLRNSIEAYEGVKENRKFILDAKVIGGDYQVSVQDFGPGMPQHVLDQLGKPFFTTKESGNGVGIPLCKNIIENHGGTFTVASHLREGTLITFTLPFSP